ncbi:hypothetical protein MAPG_10030 [Magnaporthiopsis poae ATCC 64411]|uniref:Uncharacterized protein n=1 Tax=Magnaporthiopsis poae (strain ATCC 64411 / 73-15) TaxID=644358 RepID=A0A0C4EBI1_MAGP6|nr:hypothetical protein MAPG_10030 [Magnaporthiopsis poae ATCC 64411]
MDRVHVPRNSMEVSTHLGHLSRRTQRRARDNDCSRSQPHCCHQRFPLPSPARGATAACCAPQLRVFGTSIKPTPTPPWLPRPANSILGLRRAHRGSTARAARAHDINDLLLGEACSHQGQYPRYHDVTQNSCATNLDAGICSRWQREMNICCARSPFSPPGSLLQLGSNMGKVGHCFQGPAYSQMVHTCTGAEISLRIYGSATWMPSSARNPSSNLQLLKHCARQAVNYSSPADWRSVGRVRVDR